jgi:hypothetical protein
MKPTRGGKRPGAGRPAGEKTALVRIYAADRAKLRKHGKTDALAVRTLIGKATP